MDKREGGCADVDNFLIYNIIIKSRNVDKGRGGGSTNVDKDFCMF